MNENKPTISEILEVLESGSSVLLERERLDEFWKYTLKQKHCYDFWYDYFENMVKITLCKQGTVFIVSTLIKY